MSCYVIDAFAWIEYFNGSEIGKNVKNIVENSENRLFTNVITVSELVSSYKRRNLSFDEERKSLITLSKVYGVNLDFGEKAGNLHADLKKQRKHIGMADIYVLLTAKKLKAKVVTGDEDFRGLKDVIMIK